MFNTDEMKMLENADGTYQVECVTPLFDQTTGEYVNATFTMPKCSVEFDEDGNVTNIIPFAEEQEGKIILSEDDK